MKIINVIPLSRGIFKETLSYFASKDIPVGSIVTVEVRKKNIGALVVSTEDAEKVKTKIRTSSYQMKKIEAVAVKYFFLPQFVKAAKETVKTKLNPKLIANQRISSYQSLIKKGRYAKTPNVWIKNAASPNSLIKEPYAGLDHLPLRDTSTQF